MTFPTTSDRGIPTNLPANLDRAKVDVELLAWDGTEWKAIRTLRQGEQISRRDVFRYRVRFKPTEGWDPADLLDYGLLQTPIFDDITFTYAPAGGPRILSWGQP